MGNQVRATLANKFFCYLDHPFLLVYWSYPTTLIFFFYCTTLFTRRGRNTGAGVVTDCWVKASLCVTPSAASCHLEPQYLQLGKVWRKRKVVQKDISNSRIGAVFYFLAFFNSKTYPVKTAFSLIIQKGSLVGIGWRWWLGILNVVLVNSATWVEPGFRFSTFRNDLLFCQAAVDIIFCKDSDCWIYNNRILHSRSTINRDLIRGFRWWFLLLFHHRLLHLSFLRQPRETLRKFDFILAYARDSKFKTFGLLGGTAELWPKGLGQELPVFFRT